MKLTTRRVIAATLPLATIAGAALAASAAPTVRVTTKSAVTVGGVRPASTAVGAYAGGATLPLPAYLGKVISSGTSVQGAAHSVFGYLFPALTYCATGSGKGKGVFEGPSGTVSNPCANAGSNPITVGGTVGFNPASSGTLGVKIPALTGSDSPVSKTDYTNYITNLSGLTTEPTQIPSVIGAVGMYYNEPACGTLTLSEVTIGDIFAGKITTWAKIPGLPSSDTNPIVVVYRSDGSGTSFIFSNNLATTAGVGFSGNQQFYPATGVSSSAFPTAPAGSLGEKGNGGVFATVNATAHAFGYVESGFIANQRAAGVAVPGTLAKVINRYTNTAQDSLLNLPETAASITYAAVIHDAIVVTGNGPATTQSLVSNGITPPVPGCVALVKPSAYANPAKGYPIAGVTYLLAAYKGNGALTASERNVINGLNTPTNFAGNITTVDAPTVATGTGKTGYSALGTTFNLNLKSLATKCINN